MTTSPVLLLSLTGHLLGFPASGFTDSFVSRAESGANNSGLVQPAQVQFDAARFDSLTAANLRIIFQAAADQGIPTGPLINRALEGAARKVHPSKILQVVRDYSAAMSQAREALGVNAPASELEAGASALISGLDLKAVAEVREVRPTGTAVVPLTVLTDIVKRGVPAKTARQAVTSLAKMPGSDDALRGLQVTVAKNAIRGPGMAVDALNRYLRGTNPGANPQTPPVTPDRKPIKPPTQ